MNIEQEEVWAKQLRESRLKFKMEMQAALSCRTPQQKRDLVARWKSEYSPISVNELLRVARNKPIAGEIANWDVDKM
jgi:hypothetical protein